ncbi:MAG TPA: hypothetical protein VFW52_02875 [Candidatus Saccharimonadales bacterium]|nr:hypothetical protein [Candidatus Saccharimonadales bacterium]
MPEKKFFELEGDSKGLIWLAHFSNNPPVPYCKKHRLVLIRDVMDVKLLKCPEDSERFTLRHHLAQDAELARQKIFHDSVENLELVRIDPEGYQVVAKETLRKDPNFWIEAKLSNTSKGLQLMVQTGKKDQSGEKVQLFVEPAAKRMDFDRGGSDIHPSGIFTKVVADFKDTSVEIADKTSIK